MDRIPETSDKREAPSVDLGQVGIGLNPEHYHAALAALPGFSGVILRGGDLTATFQREPSANTKRRAKEIAEQLSA